MRSVIALFAFGAVVVTTPAMAWDPTASAAASGGAATSSATAHSGAYATGGRAVANGGTSNVTVNGAGGGGNGSGATYRGAAEPPSAAISVAGPCVKGGVSIGGGGYAGGGLIQWANSDLSCRLLRLGMTEAALAALCNESDDAKQAVHDTGALCPGEKLQPVVVAAQKETIPDWCDPETSSPTELRKYGPSICPPGRFPRPIRKPGE